MRLSTLSAIGLALLHSTAFAAGIEIRPVSFQNDGVTLAGTLYLPADYKAGEKRPGVLVTGAWTSIKEQMSGLYAEEMAKRGFVALAFDFRGWGQSSGNIRFKEDPLAKADDIVAAADYMTTLPEIDAGKIAGLGICASAGYMAAAASGNPDFTAISLVAPWLHDKAIVERIYGGADGVSRLIVTSRAAEEAERSGWPRVIVAASADDSTALMYQIPYYTEPTRGLIPQYDNKFNLASWEPWLTYDSVATGDRLDKPTLIVHSEAAAVPQGAHAFFARLPGEASEIWLDGVTQFDFYDNPEDVTRAADAAAAHFERINKGS
ncbi:alpha/beta hydrolase [Rhizobium leguminosarum]|uniref:alpha/beta hydrolase n=1 Tax=Rhizobium leguminosarum TaxID=384 RepID=UPI001C964532|nr:alpha/beta hydrolase [Rhizobium leguminosarum]MBY5564596.1 alpha/beta hydrolase [Rhizobium leguminosarum]MBY5624364.1 alpha/beta hydrolase [Rhizobium leguminosarum]